VISYNLGALICALSTLGLLG